MPKSLRTSAGGPNLRTRLLAALVLVGLLVLTAPIVVVPVLSALLRAVF